MSQLSKPCLGGFNFGKVGMEYDECDNCFIPRVYPSQVSWDYWMDFIYLTVLCHCI